MKTFSVPQRGDVSPANQAIFDHFTNTLGFVPNLYAAIGRSGNGLSRYLDYQHAKSIFSNREKEAINLVVSQVNNCVYCQSAHTVIGRMNGFTDEQMLGLRKAKAADSKLDALVKLAAAITRDRGNVQAGLVENFYAAGYTDEALVDLVLQVSEKTAMNYLHNLIKVPVDFPLAPSLEPELPGSLN